MLKKLKAKFKSLEFRWAKTSPKRYVAFLRKRGIIIGENIWFTPFLDTVWIDLTRPSLVTIGDNVRINKNFTLLTHDGGYYALLQKYNEFILFPFKYDIIKPCSDNARYYGQYCKKHHRSYCRRREIVR